MIVGRAWCGWICPLGTILEVLRLKRKGRQKNPEPSINWRRVKTYVLLLLLGAALAGNLTLLILDPLSLLTRGLAGFILPGLNQTALWLESLLYEYSVLQAALDVFETKVRGSLFPADVWRWWNVLPGLLLLAVIALNTLAERFWCRYLCPLGALLGWLSRVALIRRTVQEESCRNCALCARHARWPPSIPARALPAIRRNAPSAWIAWWSVPPPVGRASSSLGTPLQRRAMIRIAATLSPPWAEVCWPPL